MEKKSILHPKMQGLMVFSGLQGIGKSTLAFNAERPEFTAILDFDQKGKAMADDYGIKQYFAPDFLQPGQEPTDYDAHKLALWCMKILHDKLSPETTHVIVDDATSLEPGLGEIVKLNPAKYGVRPDNAAKGQFGGVNPGISVLWKNIASYLQVRGVRLITMVNHMTNPWVDSKPMPNRFHVKGNKIFRQLSVLSVVLVPGEEKRGGQPPVPSALVVKEMMANRRWVEELEDYENIRTLPARIPIAKWKNIKGYFDAPANFKNPAPGETWSKFEVDAYGEFLSDEQKQWIKDAALIKYSEDGATPEEPASKPVSHSAPAPKAPPAHKEEHHDHLTPRQRFIRSLLDTKLFADTNDINKALKGRAWTEEGAEELKKTLIAERQLERQQTADLHEIAGDPHEAGDPEAK